MGGRQLRERLGILVLAVLALYVQLGGGLN
jgi:hypothetical protein